MKDCIDADNSTSCKLCEIGDSVGKGFKLQANSLTCESIQDNAMEECPENCYKCSYPDKKCLICAENYYDNG